MIRKISSDANVSVPSSHGVRTMYAKPSRTSTSRATAGCRVLPLSASGRSPRSGMSGTFRMHTAATTPVSAVTASAAPGDETAMSALASAGPPACMSTGRAMPSKPFAASSWSSGSTLGSSAEYAG